MSPPTGKPSTNWAIFAMIVASLSAGHCVEGMELFRLGASNSMARDYFGQSVALDDGVAIVGSPSEDSFGVDSGAAYLFDAKTGTVISRLAPSDPEPDDYFGVSVAIDGGKAIVGSPSDDDVALNAGSAYVFDVRTGKQLAKLTANDPIIYANFGSSVALSDGVAVVGSPLSGRAPGAAYLFDVSTGNQIAKLTGSDPRLYDGFPSSVAISGGVAVIGHHLDDDAGRDAGAAYLFDVSSGRQIAKLVPNDLAPSDYFGRSVAISGGIALVGSALQDGLFSATGAVYVFNATSGQQLAKLTPSDPTRTQFFGASVAIDGNVALIGSSYDSGAGMGAGSAYLFEVTTGKQLAKYFASDASSGNQFGSSVALDESVAVVGSPFGDWAVNDSGTAYLIDISVPEPTSISILASIFVGVNRRRGPVACPRGSAGHGQRDTLSRQFTCLTRKRVDMAPNRGNGTRRR